MHYLHAMIRTTDPKRSLAFYCEGLGLKLIKEKHYPDAKFSLYFVGESASGPLIELTHNHDDRSYSGGDQFGHLAFEVDDIYHTCQHLMDNGVTLLRPPKDGRMAFVKDPNGISIELLQKDSALEITLPWSEMPNLGTW